MSDNDFESLLILTAHLFYSFEGEIVMRYILKNKFIELGVKDKEIKLQLSPNDVRKVCEIFKKHQIFSERKGKSNTYVYSLNENVVNVLRYRYLTLFQSIYSDKPPSSADYECSNCQNKYDYTKAMCYKMKCTTCSSAIVMKKNQLVQESEIWIVNIINKFEEKIEFLKNYNVSNKYFEIPAVESSKVNPATAITINKKHHLVHLTAKIEPIKVKILKIDDTPAKSLPKVTPNALKRAIESIEKYSNTSKIIFI